MALPFNTPPEIGACGVGLGVGAGGGGASSIFTVAGALSTMPVPAPGADGAAALEFAHVGQITVCTLFLTGGMSLALVPKSFGTRSARDTSAIACWRTSTFFGASF